MSTWIPMFARPNIDAQQIIEVEGIALVTLRDDRLNELTKKHRRFAMYMRRFKNEFGQRVWSNVIIRNSARPKNTDRLRPSPDFGTRLRRLSSPIPGLSLYASRTRLVSATPIGFLSIC